MAAALLVSAPLLAAAQEQPAFERPATQTSVATEQASVRFIFDRALVAGYGFELEPSVDRLDLEAAPPSSFVVDAADADFEGITSGALHLTGGFTLAMSGKTVSMVGLEVQPGDRPMTLNLVDTRGVRLLTGDQMHFRYDPTTGRLRLENVDVRIAPELAAEIGRPELAGIAIARLELEASTRAFRSPTPEACTSCSKPVWPPAGEVDVALADLYSVQQIVRDTPTSEVTIGLSTQIRSGGTADAAWFRKFAPCTASAGYCGPYFHLDQHPYLTWAFYRIAPIAGPGTPTAVVMLGQSALKHAFFATNQDCFCQGDQILFAPIGNGCTCGDPTVCTHDSVACTDVYGNGNNDDHSAIGPRDELEAHSGIWNSTGSYFDQDSDGVCDWHTAGVPGGDCGIYPYSIPNLDRRLAVKEAALAVTGATYYADAWYIVRDDVNIFNNFGWRQVTPALGSSWTFSAVTTLAQGSVLDAWVSHTAPPAGTSHVRIDTGVGHLSLAAKATEPSPAQYHYEYALANHDFDRKVQSFRVPLPKGATVSNAVFRGLGTGSGADWTMTIAADAVTFQAPADVAVNALDWGTLFSFGFDADVAPAAGSVDLGALEETPALLFSGAAVTPGGARGSAIFFDDFESGGSARWSSVQN